MRDAAAAKLGLLWSTVAPRGRLSIARIGHGLGLEPSSSPHPREYGKLQRDFGRPYRLKLLPHKLKRAFCPTNECLPIFKNHHLPAARVLVVVFPTAHSQVHARSRSSS